MLDLAPLGILTSIVELVKTAEKDYKDERGAGKAKHDWVYKHAKEEALNFISAALGWNLNPVCRVMLKGLIHYFIKQTVDELTKKREINKGRDDD
jgi:hypothetical protein